MTIEQIFIAAASGGPQQACERVTVVAGAGIEGDRYYARHDEPGQNITLVEAEAIEAFLGEQQRPLDLSVTHRNLVTRGVRLNDLVGREFTVGPVRLRGVELCEPCMGLGQALAGPSLTPAEVVKCLVHRAGLRADVLCNGVIARGDTLQAID
ncbi:MOSC domain-containing protein [Ideonella sp.]|uniref:MOSC domain-containing protein n=1 Tax=Ideonella sp. TaxID=1929293 RepID=UPI0035B04361